MAFESRRPRGAILALLAGVAAALSVLVQIVEVAALREPPLGPAMLGFVVLLVGGIVESRRSGDSDARARLDLPRIGFWLASLSLAVVSVLEQPTWPSIDTYGTAIPIPYLAVLAFTGVIGFDCALGKARRVESAVAALTIFAAFGGPQFLRDGSSFHALYGLLCVAAIAYAAPDLSLTRSPSLRAFWIAIAVLIGVSLVPFSHGVDRGHHLAGSCRLLMAFAPIPLIFAARDRLAVARTAAFAFCFALLLGVLSGATAILEAASFVDLAHVLRARLSLFGEHPNIIAPYFALGIPLAIAATFQSRRLAVKLLCLAIAGGAFVALDLTQSRASLAGGAVGIVMVLVLGLSAPLTRRLDSRAKWIAFLLILGIGVIGGGLAMRHKIAKKLADPSMEFRVYMWSTATSALRDRPLSGYGFLSSEPLMSHAEPSDLDGRTKDTHPHMMVLSFALGAGIPAAILFTLILLAMALRASQAAVQTDELSTRFLAAATAASLIALFLSNLLDQGLALNTPIPLHVGTLLALLAGVVPRAPDEADGAARRPSILLWIAVLLVFAHSLQSRISDCLTAIARTATQDRDAGQAATFAGIAYAIDPLDRDVVLRHAAALDRTGKRQEAADVLAEATARFPLSPYPWEALANLEYDRRNWTSALMALTRARQRDPTGPSASQWSLRIANIHANLGMRAEAMDEFARAIRFDYEAAQRAGWTQDGQKEYFVPVAGSDVPIFLSSILQRNRELLPNAVRTQPVQARRIATTIVKIALGFRKFEFARDVIAEYKSLTSEPWLPLEHLESELDRIERHENGEGALASETPDQVSATANDESPSPTTDRPADPIADNDRFAATAGQSVVFLDQGRSLAEAKDYAAALESFRKGLAAAYDIVAERQYIAMLQDGIFDSALAIPDLALARQELPANLYFHVLPADRISIHVRLARAEITANDFAGAESTIATSLGLLTMLAPNRADDSASQVGEIIGAMLRGSEAERAEALLASFSNHGSGVLAAMYAYRAANRTELAEGAAKRLRTDFPDWLKGGHGRRPRK